MPQTLSKYSDREHHRSSLMQGTHCPSTDCPVTAPQGPLLSLPWGFTPRQRLYEGYCNSRLGPECGIRPVPLVRNIFFALHQEAASLVKIQQASCKDSNLQPLVCLLLKLCFGCDRYVKYINSNQQKKSTICFIK